MELGRNGDGEEGRQWSGGEEGVKGLWERWDGPVGDGILEPVETGMCRGKLAFLLLRL